MESATRIGRQRAEHERAKVVLQTEHGLQKTEKERVQWRSGQVQESAMADMR